MILDLLLWIPPNPLVCNGGKDPMPPMLPIEPPKLPPMPVGCAIIGPEDWKPVGWDIID